MGRLISHPAVLPTAAAVFIGAILASIMAFAGLYQSRIGWVTHTLEVERELSRFYSTVQDAEIATRGYVLTGDAGFLDLFSRARTEAPQELDRLSALTNDNPLQTRSIEQLRDLLAEKIDGIIKAIDLRKANKGAEAINLFVTGRGGQILVAMRDGIGEMEKREESYLASRNDDARNSGVMLLLVGGIAILAALAVILLWIRDRFRSARAMAAANVQLETTLTSLRKSQEELQQEIKARAVVEAQLRQVHKMEAVGQLTGGIAHDFNNMLAVVMSSVTLTRKRIAKGDGNIAPLLDAAMDAANRAAKLTSRLLAFSRQQPLAPEPLDANKFVSGITDLLQRTLGERIQVETVLGGGLWRVNADASQLENAILNLAVNARDAMPDGGKLTLETANTALDDDYARDNADVAPGQYVMIAVSDSGEGMKAETIERAFDPFFTTKPVGSGTGLGLSQVFGFVKQSGGNVKIYSEVGRGTTVKIYLPRYFGEKPEAPRPVAIPEIRKEDICESILVVEDEHRLREVTTAGLRDMGYAIYEAANGADALKLIDAHPELHCLFTDIVMPDMTGRQLADEAAKRRPNLRVLYTTGYTRNAVVHNGVLDPGVQFLPKPFTLDQLSLKLREVLGPPSGRNGS